MVGPVLPENVKTVTKLATGTVGAAWVPIAMIMTLESTLDASRCAAIVGMTTARVVIGHVSRWGLASAWTKTGTILAWGRARMGDLTVTNPIQT